LALLSARSCVSSQSGSGVDSPIEAWEGDQRFIRHFALARVVCTGLRIFIDHVISWMRRVRRRGDQPLHLPRGALLQRSVPAR
jgi:hypothetical protein